MVWKSRCLARTCLRAVDIDRTEGGASSGTGVDVPLSTVPISIEAGDEGRRATYLESVRFLSRVGWLVTFG